MYLQEIGSGAWENVKNIFSNIAKGLGIPQIPKLKVGMDYVPEDDFPALLHEGEAVLTKEENKEYRQNKSKGDNKEEKQTIIYEGDLIVNIDKFYNETDNDVEAFGEQLAFVYKKKNRRKGEK